MEKSLRYLVVGDINIDIIFKGIKTPPIMGQEIFVSDMDVCLGGSAANTASALGKLGAHVALWTRVAQDEFGPFLLKSLSQAGVELRHVKQILGGKSGVSVAMTNHHDRSFISFPGTNQEVDFAGVKETDLAGYTYLHLSGFDWERNFPGYLTLLQRAKRMGMITSFDLGWTEFDRHRSSLWEILPWVDYFFPNEVEALALTQASDLSTALEKLGEKISVPVITLGNRGAVTRWKGQEIHEPAFQVESIDSVGAGDAFAAGFLWAIGQGMIPPEALRVANACGALTSAGIGGGAAAPSHEALLEFLNRSSIKIARRE